MAWLEKFSVRMPFNPFEGVGLWRRGGAEKRREALVRRLPPRHALGRPLESLGLNFRIPCVIKRLIRSKT